jgi:hypothetical protein
MKKDPCWKGYEMIGTKKKGARTVPNCVPVKEMAQGILDKAQARLKEGRGSEYTLYHKSYTDAVNHALDHHAKRGLKASDDDRMHHIGIMSKKPSEGKTTSVNLPATHEKTGKKHMIHMQVYNKGGSHPYELNTYSSSAGHVKEDTTWYPKEGFPKEGEYGYQPNPGLKPQESDKDEDMDKAYKTATEAEAPKPLNAKKLEVSNKVEESNVFTDARMNAIKAGKKSFSAGGKTYKVTGDTSDEKAAANVKEEVLSERGADSKGYYRKTEDGAGLTRKGAKAMGVKTAVTTPPSKLDPNGKAAKRRKSFCARMGGMKGPMKDEKGRPTRKAMSLRRWNCNEDTQLDEVSRTTLDQYHDKASKSMIDNPRNSEIVRKRERGIATAFRKSGFGKAKVYATEDMQLDEVLGKENEWGRPELRKKFAAMTPGQESLCADTIPVMDPHSGFAPTADKKLNEISAKGAKLRSEFAAKLQKRLADYNASAKKTKQDVSKHKAASDTPSEHLVMQLRKASSIGSKVKFRDGSEHHVAPNHVEKFNDRYHSLKSSIEKESYVKRAHKSHADFMHAISEAVYMFPMVAGGLAPCTSSVSPANYPTPDQVSPPAELGDMNNDGMENEWDEAAIEADAASEIESANWQDLSNYYDDDDLEDEEEDDISEGLTPQGRLKKKFAAIRTKGRRNLAKNLQLKRVATPDRIKKRSIRAARNMVYKRLLRNRDRSNLSAAEKTRIEAMVKRMAPMVGRLSVRLQQKERTLDRTRIQNRNKKKK